MGVSITPHQPGMTKPGMKKKNPEVFKAVVFTDFSLYKWTQENLTEYKIMYVGYGLETCPTSKKEHHQGWLYAGTDAKRGFKSWKKVFKALGLKRCISNKCREILRRTSSTFPKKASLPSLVLSLWATERSARYL